MELGELGKTSKIARCKGLDTDVCDPNNWECTQLCFVVTHSGKVSYSPLSALVNPGLKERGGVAVLWL